MKAFFGLMFLIPSLCLAGTNIVYDTAKHSAADVTLSDETKTAVDFHLSGLTIESVTLDGKDFTKVLPPEEELIKFGFTNEVGLPDLPVYSSMIIIPDRAGVRVNLISAEYETYNNVEVAPTQPWALESGQRDESFAMDQSFYGRDEFYPLDIVVISEPMIIRDFRFVQAVVHPYQYNPSKKELRVYTHVNYELIYAGSDERNIKVRRDNHISEAFVDIYKAVFSNAGFVLDEYEPVRGGYLILTPNNLNFADTIATLATWKHRKGYYVHVAPSSEITPSGIPSYAQVYTYILNAYNNWETRPDYVLIVGDEDQRIPDYPYSTYTSDHQYSTLEGDDYFSDVLLARMSVDNMSELLVAMYKVLKYEQNPSMTDPGYWKRGLGVAGNIGATSPRITNLWVRDLAMEHGYTRVDTVFDWGSGAPNWSTISTAINAGVSYVSYRGWAGPSGWYNPDYTTTNLGQLTNGWKTGIMASIVCGTGDFGTDVCFGEAWIRYGSTTLPKGGTCFYGCTDHGTHTAWNNPNMTGFFWSLFDQNLYHFAQMMFMGKLNVFQAYPSFNGPGGTINKYFNTYNSLGDPELAVRTEIPRAMAVEHSPSITVGTNFLNVHVTSGALPLTEAYVNLVKGYGNNEQIFEGGVTDESGDISFEFENTNTDTIFVTVTARDYIPYMGYCLVTSPTISLGIDTVYVNDNSGGNNDGHVNAGEHMGLTPRLRNFGTSIDATNISAVLSSPDNRVTVITGNQSYPNIAHGNSASPNGQFVIEVADNVPHGERLLLNLAVTASEGSWQSLVALDIVSVKPVQIAVSFPDIPGNRINPGQTANMVISFSNGGGLNGQQITGQLSCADQFISIADNYGSFGNIDVGQTGSNSANPFRISVGEEAYDGRNVNFTIAFTGNNTGIGNYDFEKTFSIVIGSVSTFDPVGPDNYGYYMYDNTDLGYSPAPIYNWVEINPNLGGSGTRMNVAADDGSVLIALPSNIRYYGHNYGHMIVSTNGFVAFDTIPYDQAGNYWQNWDNWPIPDPGNARAQISPFWDDLEYVGSTNGIYQYNDVANGRFIIEWSGCRHARTAATETFQIIFYNPTMHPTPTGDWEIAFQYREITNNDFNPDPQYPEAYSSVGIEDYTQNDGLEYEYDNIYHPGAAPLANGLAIKITTATGLAAPPDMSFNPDEFSFGAMPGDRDEGYIYITNSGEGYLYYTLSLETIEGVLAKEAQNKIATASPAPIVPIVSAAKSDSYTGPYNPPVILDSGGPDNFGYTWIDSDEPGGPVYNWKDISSLGTPVSWPGDTDDGIATGIPIGFDFSFYGNIYDALNICTNGFLSFTSTATAYNNATIPTADEPNNLLAVYWDDLNFEPRGACYYYTNNEDSFIVAYVGVPHYSDEGLFTFEAILLGSGKIIFQYQEASGVDVNQETVGIENANGMDGLQVCNYSAYVEPGLAVMFSAAPRWLSAAPTNALIEPHRSDTITVNCDASDLEIGQYEGIIHMQTNDHDYPAVDIPVHFSVFIPSDCEYMPGDINSDGSLTLADITYGLQYIKGIGNAPPDSCWIDQDNIWLYAAGDVNGNCEFLGSDISYLVKYFRGDRPAPGWCPDTPPPTQRPSGDIKERENKNSVKRDK